MLRAPFVVVVCVAVAGAAGGCGAGTSPEKTRPSGAPAGAGTRALEAGADVLQDMGPVKTIDIHLVGFHPMKEQPSRQVEAHHFCRQVNEDFAQCILYDGDTESANLNGIEYIISEKLFLGLPAAEREYWHPHNFEILSGQLTAPGLPDVAEKELMRKKVNSYGKTWHLWMTGGSGGSGDQLPLGPAKLAWSFNADGEIQPALLEAHLKRTGLDLAEKRRQRQDLAALARPQQGVDALAGRLPRSGRPDGVTAR